MPIAPAPDSPAPAAAPAAVLDISGLCVTYGVGRGTLTGSRPAAPVLRDVSMSVSAGEVVAVVGESGSGKTTLGHAVLGLLPAESRPSVQGSIRLCGTEIVGAAAGSLRSLLRSDLGAVFQDPMTSLNPTMRIGRQLAEALSGDVNEPEWLRRVGITEPARILRSFPHELSGGQRQRVMIAMAMAKAPRLVVADEPTTALDVTVQAQILQLIRRLCLGQGTAFLFVTHDLAVAAALADRIVVLYSGKIVERGRTAAVASAPGHPYTAALLSARFGFVTPRDRQLPTIASAAVKKTPAGEPACAFALRCLLATDLCMTSAPPDVPAPGHDGVVACHRTGQVTGELWHLLGEAWPVSKPGETGPLLSFCKVSKTYRARRQDSRGRWLVHALRDVSFSVDRGEAVAVVGESGSGKSTLLKLAAGSLMPDAGRIDYAPGDPPQIVFQAAAASLTPWLTVGTQIEDRLRRIERDPARRSRRIAETLGMVGLPAGVAKAYPAELSGGQAQRVAIARAIVEPPKLLLCDEAVSALDVSLAAATLNLLGVLRRRLGMSILFVTHDLAAARFIADRIVVLKAGEVVEAGESERLIAGPKHPYTERLLADSPDRLHLSAA